MNEPTATTLQPATDHSIGGGNAAAHTLVRWNLAVLAGGFAWFAYIDAPITDGAMWLFATAVIAAFLSLITALLGCEARSAAAGARTRRASQLLFGVALGLLLASGTVTLNLKGTGSDESDTQTGEVIHT